MGDNHQRISAGVCRRHGDHGKGGFNTIAALAEYSAIQQKKAKRELKRGESGSSAKCVAESAKAQAVMMSFCGILTEPAGSCMI